MVSPKTMTDTWSSSPALLEANTTLATLPGVKVGRNLIFFQSFIIQIISCYNDLLYAAIKTMIPKHLLLTVFL